jgi:putative hydrolase of the HAD superfamily
MKNIIFDLGNVLVLFDPSGYVNNSVVPEKREKFLDVVFRSIEWRNLDLGTLTYLDAKKIFKEKLKDCDTEVDNLFGDNLFGLLKPIVKNTELLKRLKENYNLYILSNFHKESFEEVSVKHEFFSHFDGGIVSAYYQCIKPEKKIYRLLLDKYNLNPQETLFIDDLAENVEAAEKIGINTIHLTDYNTLADKLKEKNIIF